MFRVSSPQQVNQGGTPFLAPGQGMTFRPSTPNSDVATPTNLNNFPPQLTVQDIQRKRRAAQFEVEPTGSPFLKPNQNISQKKSFFRLHDINGPDSRNMSNIFTKISTYPPNVHAQIAKIFNVNPPTLEGLYRFLSSVPPNDQNAIASISIAIDSVLKQQQFNSMYPQPPPPPNSAPGWTPPAPRLGPVFSYDFVDVRYCHCEEENMIFKKPIAIGLADFNLSFQVPPLSPDFHVVIQSFIVGVAPAIVRWPPSFSIYVNGQQVKAPGLFNFPLIDTFEFGANSIVHINCQKESEPFALLIRVAKYQSFNSIVAQIQMNNTDQSVFNPRNVSLICPLTGKLMKYPGKGINCAHPQCFDLKEYMKRATIIRNWVCPICRHATTLQQLVFSQQTYDD
ncbi:MIZ zinc finger family protein [Histomonas meleagridis]|nr:MIZ zinc finger family protein [Histomonas meleagridis]